MMKVCSLYAFAMDNELNNKSRKTLIAHRSSHLSTAFDHIHIAQNTSNAPWSLLWTRETFPIVPLSLLCAFNWYFFFAGCWNCCVRFLWIVLPLLYLNPFGVFLFAFNFVGRSELIAMENPFYRDNRQCMQIMENTTHTKNMTSPTKRMKMTSSYNLESSSGLY